MLNCLDFVEYVPSARCSSSKYSESPCCPRRIALRTRMPCNSFRNDNILRSTHIRLPLRQALLFSHFGNLRPYFIALTAAYTPAACSVQETVSLTARMLLTPPYLVSTASTSACTVTVQLKARGSLYPIGHSNSTHPGSVERRAPWVRFDVQDRARVIVT